MKRLLLVENLAEHGMQMLQKNGILRLMIVLANPLHIGISVFPGRHLAHLVEFEDKFLLRQIRIFTEKINYRTRPVFIEILIRQRVEYVGIKP